MQSIQSILPLAAKCAWIPAEAAGICEIEVGSFVPGKLLPLLADTAQVIKYARNLPGLTVAVVVPTLKGAQAAVHAGAHKRTVPSALQASPPVVLLLAATILEVSGDAVVRIALYNHAGLARLVLFLAGATLLFGYGTFLNLAPLQFGQVVGLYLATLFVVWQVIYFVAFRFLLARFR